MFRVITVILKTLNKLLFLSCFRLFVNSFFCFRMASFCLFAWHVFAWLPFVFSRRNNASEKTLLRKDEKDETTPGEKTKDERTLSKKKKKTPHNKTRKFKFQMASFRMAFFFLLSLRAKFLSFRLVSFFFSHGIILSFRLFAWHYFRLFAWHLFVFSHGVFFTAKRRYGNKSATLKRRHAK